MKRAWLGTLVGVAIACTLPSLSRAAEPEVAGQVTGMSELPDRVQNAVTREASRSSSHIRELRAEPRGVFRAELDRDGHGEIVTFDRAGRIIERNAY